MAGGSDLTGEAVCRVLGIPIGDGDLDLDFRIFHSLISGEVSLSFSCDVKNSCDSEGLESKVGSIGSLLVSDKRSRDTLGSVLSSMEVVTDGEGTRGILPC